LADRADEAAAGFAALGSDATLPDNFRAAARLRQAAALLKARRPGPAGRAVAELLAMPSSTAQKDAEALAVRLLRESPGALPVSTLRRVLELPGVTALEQTAVQLTMADELMAMGRYAQARTFYERVLAATEASPLVRGVAQLAVVRSHLRENDLPAAEAAWAKLPKMDGIPPHFALEARQQIDEAKRVAAGLPARDPAATRTRIAPLPSPAITLHVATDGADANPGTADHPLATLEGARDLLRSLKAAGKLDGPAEVVVRGGTYRVTQSLKLSAADSGTAEAPITYRAASGEKPVFSGGVQLTGFRPVDDAAVLARLPEESRGKVFGVDLASHGISKFEPLKLGGFASGLGFQTFPMIELFFDGRALPLSRWPNEGFVQVAEAPAPEPGARSGAGMKAGWFRYDGDRPQRWQQEKDILLYGYWWHSWADSYERVTSIDVAEKKIQLAEPFHRYGYRKGQPFYAVNLLAEIDRPGEWYLDRSSGTLYVYPPSDPNKALIQLSTGAFPFVVIDGASHLGFRQLTWELGAADAIMVKNANHIELLGCTLQRFAGNGIEFQGGTHNRIIGCDIHSMGRGGAIIGGGDRKTLTPGGHVVENCHIHDLSRIDHTYTPAVKMTGVGHRVAHNLMHDIDSSAINMTGNDHVIERNEVCRVVRESDDQGGLDSFGNATYRGNVIRHNFWHHIGNWSGEGEVPHCGQAGVRLDDAISGVLIYGNVFYRCSAGQMGFGGVQIHGGKDNLIDGNLFVDCSAAISFSPWGQQRWQTFTAKSLDAGDVDRALYLARYPELARLADDHDVNAVSRNLVYDCGEFLRRDRGQTQAVGNHVTDENPGFIDAGAGDIRMNPRLPAFERAGQATIPLDEIGPYRDEFRRERPSP
jgi:hypothetical protein